MKWFNPVHKVRRVYRNVKTGFNFTIAIVAFFIELISIFRAHFITRHFSAVILEESDSKCRATPPPMNDIVIN